MTSQEKKAFLGRYLKISAEEKDLREEIVYWESKAQKVTSAWTTVPEGGNKSDKVQDGAVKLAELHEMLKSKADDLTQTRIEIERVIGTMENAVQRRLLRLRYIQGMTWERIAVEMDYSYQWVCELHGRALRTVQIETVDSN